VYVPTAVADETVVTHTGVALRDDTVSPLTNPEYDGVGRLGVDP
jgi:hypothetical protein